MVSPSILAMPVDQFADRWPPAAAQRTDRRAQVGLALLALNHLGA